MRRRVLTADGCAVPRQPVALHQARTVLLQAGLPAMQRANQHGLTLRVSLRANRAPSVRH
jgi:hypothetical protein